MTAAKTVTATFNVQRFTLTVNETGSGTVSGGGISCPGTCTGTYDSGTSVTLTAAAGSGYTFGSWSGCNTVSGTTCTVTMSAARTVTATFSVSVTRFPLTVNPAGAGSGT